MKEFTFPGFSDDGILPKNVPRIPLERGAMPVVGMGTFGSDHVSGETVAEAVVTAASLGYRHFDCAAVYGNEQYIGRALQSIMKGGIERSSLFITSKLWNDKHAPEEVIPACKKTLCDLGLEYLDCYLIHWPFPNHHPEGCSVTVRSPDAKPYTHTQYLAVWRELEKLHDLGLVRAIGTSNMTVLKLELLLNDCRIRPAVNQMELHPHFQQPELFRFVKAAGIVPVGFSPIGSPGRPDRDRTEQDTVDLEDPVIKKLAFKYNVHAAAICIRWAITRGQVPIPFSVRRNNLLSNLQAAVSAPLTDEEMRMLENIDKKCRLIKGQVFLWKDGHTWEDLWK